VTSHDLNVVQGGLATARFTVAPGCEDVEISLVSYMAPSAQFSRETAHLQVLFDSVTELLDAGEHTLEVDVADCFWQVDLVFGRPLMRLGLPNNFYKDQGRRIDGPYGGSGVCPTPTTSTPTSQIATGTTISAASTTPPSTISALPFTGRAAVPLLVAGLLLIMAGTALLRRAAARPGRR
jgi:hypothetical protein